MTLTWTGLVSLLNSNKVDLVENSRFEMTAPSIVTSSNTSIYMPQTGSAAIAIDPKNTLKKSGSNESLPMASIAKTITALVVLQQTPLGDSFDPGPTVTFNAKDENILNSAIADGLATQPVRDGLKMSLRDAISVMMLASAGNYATSIATHTFGSMESYLDTANAWLATNGLVHSRVVDASGISPNNVGTTDEILKLGFLAQDNKALASIVKMPSINVEGVGEVQNGNPALGIGGINGIKVGSTFEADECLLYSFPLNIAGKTQTAMGVSLGMPDFGLLVSDVQKLIRSLAANIVKSRQIERGQTIGTIHAQSGSQFDVVATESVELVQVPGTSVTFEVTLEPKNRVAVGETVGKLSLSSNFESKSVELVLR